MGVKQVIKKGFSAGWNVKRWVGLEQIKNNGQLIKQLAVEAFLQEKKAAPSKNETFDQCMKRLGMTEADLQKRIKTCDQIIFLCAVLSIPVLAYTVYIFMSGFYLSSFVCLMLTFLLFAYSIRELVNRFKFRQRRLTCTLKEVVRDVLNSRKK